MRRRADPHRRRARLPRRRWPSGSRPIWLTPAQDRLFLDAAAERRRFFDRLVFAGEPGHAAPCRLHERALRERLRLLLEGDADDAWLAALEARMAARRRRRRRGQRADPDGPAGARSMPGKAGPSRGPGWSSPASGSGMAAAGLDEGEIEARLRAQPGRRPRPRRGGRARAGRPPPRRSVGGPCAKGPRRRRNARPGEQKALILNLVLAQAARLSRAESAPNPILLLDEVAAHLDPSRRAALFDEIEALALQAFLTGTEEAPLRGAQGPGARRPCRRLRT